MQDPLREGLSSTVSFPFSFSPFSIFFLYNFFVLEQISNNLFVGKMEQYLPLGASFISDLFWDVGAVSHT